MSLALFSHRLSSACGSSRPGFPKAEASETSAVAAVLSQRGAEQSALAGAVRTLGWMLLSCFLCGCSINELGVVKSTLTQGNGVAIHEVFAPGIHLSTREATSSLTLGVFRAQRVLELPCVERSPTQKASPIPTDEAQFTLVRHTGLRLAMGAPEVGLTLGFHEQMIATAPVSRKGAYRHVHFVSGEPEETVSRSGSARNCTPNRGGS